MSTIESDANLLDDGASELDGSEPRLLEASFEEVRQFLLASGLPGDVVETFRLQGLDSMALVADLEEHHMRDLGLSLSESLKLRRALAKRSSGSSRPVAATTAATAARTGNGGSSNSNSNSNSNEDSTDRRSSNTNNNNNNNTTATAPVSAREEEAREAVNDVGGSLGVGGGAQRDTPSNTKSSAPGLPVLALLVAALVVVLGVAVWKEQHWSKTEADLRRQLLHSEEQRAQAQSTFQEQISELKELLRQSTNQFRESRDKDLQRLAWTLPEVTKALAQEPATWSSWLRNFVFSMVTKVIASILLCPWLSALSLQYLEAWKNKEFVNNPVGATIYFALLSFPVPFLVMLLVGSSCWFLYELAAAAELLLVIGLAVYGMWEHRLTFLHAAAVGNMPLLAYLLCYSAVCDVNAKSGDGQTPMDVAVILSGREAVTTVLKEFGAKKAEELTKS